MKHILLLLTILAAMPVQAGLFTDDEAHKKIQQLENRVKQLESNAQQLENRIKQLESSSQQHESNSQQHESNLLKLDQKLEEGNKLQTRSVLDLLGQIDALNAELRKLRGSNQELARGLQESEKREKDFYVDLDTRLRRVETAAASSPPPAVVSTDPTDPNDTTAENRAFEAAYVLFKGGSHASAAAAFQEFLKKYPKSAHTSNATYWLGSSLFALNDHEGALATYQRMLNDFPHALKAADALLNIAICQQKLNQDAVAKKTLKQLISKYPTSEAAAKAKKLVAAIK